MESKTQHRFSGAVTVFHESRLPERATPAGYSALIGAYNLSVPLPRTLSATGKRHKVYEDAGWRILTPRHAPKANIEGHLTFALKYEGIDLAVLMRLFAAAGPGEIAALVRAKPTGRYARRIWFLYEWLTGEQLDLPAAEKGTYVPAVDPNKQWAIDGKNSPRHRVRNNLPGTSAFCPLIFRTKRLDAFIEMNLPARARAVVANVPRDLLARTAAFLLLKDSKSSYAIEGERAPQS
ncbi:MAG: cell filamentation protein Fic, partial [Deltaproteobacteria bacterium]|nr:cell filamentation protein Fic [Candidatus Desulfacyla euxinica]